MDLELIVLKQIQVLMRLNRIVIAHQTIIMRILILKTSYKSYCYYYYTLLYYIILM